MAEWVVTEVPVKAVPRQIKKRGSKYDPFIRDVMLRLVQTPPSKALKYHALAPDEKVARRYTAVLRQRTPKGYVLTKIAQNGKGVDVYVWRGPQWVDPDLITENGDLP